MAKRYQRKVPFLDIQNYTIDKECLKIFTKKQALDLGVIALEIQDNIVVCCAENPVMETIIKLEALTGKIIRLVKDDIRLIRQKIEELY